MWHVPESPSKLDSSGSSVSFSVLREERKASNLCSTSWKPKNLTLEEMGILFGVSDGGDAITADQERMAQIKPRNWV